MKLTILAKKLDSLLLHKEASQILKLASGEVFAHISGPSGSGKTTVMNKIHSLHPAIAVKDLDEFDEEATEKMGLELGWKQKDPSQKTLNKHHKEKQRLLNAFLKKNKKEKIVLVGIHEEAGNVLQFNAEHKILLDVSPEEATKRRIKRDKDLSSHYQFWKDSESLKSELMGAKKIVKDLISEGYSKMSPGKIFSLFKDKT